MSRDPSHREMDQRGQRDQRDQLTHESVQAICKSTQPQPLIKTIFMSEVDIMEATDNMVVNYKWPK